MALRRAKAEGRLEDLVNDNLDNPEDSLNFADNQSNGHVISYKPSSAATRNGTDTLGSVGRGSVISQDPRAATHHNRVSFQKTDEESPKDSRKASESVEVVLEPCLPVALTSHFETFMEKFDESALGRVWVQLRKRCFMIVDHRFFEWFILGCILISSISLVRSHQIAFCA